MYSVTESGDECGSEESTLSSNFNKHKSIKSSSNKNKQGRIYCVCAFQCYENGMLLCSKCANYSHAECYNVVDINIKHICGSCAIKEDINCTNEEVKKFMERKYKTQKDHSEFAFNLMLRRVMSSILKEEYKSTQPCNQPGVEFLKIRFNMSSSYAGKMVLYLVQHGYIAFFGGFKVDENRIKQFLYPEDNTTVSNESILVESGNPASSTPVIKEKKKGNSSAAIKSGSKTEHTGSIRSPSVTPILKETKNGGIGAKNTNRKPINFTPDKYDDNEVEVVLNKKALEDEIQNPKCSGSGICTNTDIDRSSSTNTDFVDSFSNTFKKKFLWPTRFLERETRKLDEPIEPMEVSEVGKNTKRAFYGQILESAGPRINSKAQIGYNLVFSVGRNGASIQVWAFGSEDEIINLSKQVIEDTYMVFWSYEVSPKTTNKIHTTSDWVVQISPKSKCFGPVKVTRKYADPLNASGEEIERFSEKFSQASSKKPAQKRKEHSSSQKKSLKLDPSQTKMDQFLELFDDTVQLSTSSFGSASSDSTRDHSPSSPELRHSTRDNSSSPELHHSTRDRSPNSPELRSSPRDHSPSSPELRPSRKRGFVTNHTDDSPGSSKTRRAKRSFTSSSSSN